MIYLFVMLVNMWGNPQQILPGASSFHFLTLARARLLTASNVWTWSRESVGPPPPSRWALMDLELRGKHERVARNERKPMVPNYRVLGQPVQPQKSGQTRGSQ